MNYCYYLKSIRIEVIRVVILLLRKIFFCIMINARICHWHVESSIFKYLRLKFTGCRFIKTIYFLRIWTICPPRRTDNASQTIGYIQLILRWKSSVCTFFECICVSVESDAVSSKPSERKTKYVFPTPTEISIKTSVCRLATVCRSHWIITYYYFEMDWALPSYRRYAINHRGRVTGNDPRRGMTKKSHVFLFTDDHVPRAFPYGRVLARR